MASGRAPEGEGEVFSGFTGRHDVRGATQRQRVRAVVSENPGGNKLPSHPHARCCYMRRERQTGGVKDGGSPRLRL